MQAVRESKDRVNKYLTECWRYAPQQRLLAFLPKFSCSYTVRIYFWTLCHVPMIYMSILALISQFWLLWIYNLFFFKGCFLCCYLDYFHFYVNLESALFYETNFFSKGLHWTYISNCGKIIIVLSLLINEKEIYLYLLRFLNFSQQCFLFFNV